MIKRRKGTVRGKRLNENLLNNDFQIDQRSFWEIMGYLSFYLEKINYYNIENQMDGDWQALVKNDHIIYMVLMVNEPLTDLSNIAESYGEIRTVDYDDLTMVKVLLKWYNKISEWQYVTNSQGEKKLSNKIKNVLTDVLDHQYHQLIVYQEELLSKEQHLLKTLPPQPDEPLELDKVIHIFQKAIIHIQEFTKEYLEKNMHSDSDHLPNNAMYIAFSLLFKTIQRNLNRLSKKHLDFYYKDILHQEKSSGTPTKTIVNFELLPAIPSSLVDKGAKLSAGKLYESKKEVIFETTKPIVVYQMELMELQTLVFNKNPDLKIGTDQPLISSVSKNQLIRNGKEKEDRDDWYLFGANKQTVRSTQVTSDKMTQLGFIIGAPVLFLEDGYREISLQFNMEKESSNKLFWSVLQQIEEGGNITTDTAFSYVFNEAFRISYTSKKGWVSIQNYSVEYDKIANNITINFILESTDPALENGLGIIEQLRWPSIRVEFNEYAPVYPYSFFKGLQMNSIDIDVNVQRIRNLSLYNDVGKIATGKYFNLFGPSPELGSYLMIGKSELFKKKIEHLEIDLKWDALPKDFGGFETYYNNYPGQINNESFKVQFTALSNSYWLPIESEEALVSNLYSVHKALTSEGYKSVQLDHTSRIEINAFDQLGVTENFDLKDPLIYGGDSQSGFVKLTLIAPSCGYGQDLYQKEFTEITTYNAQNETQLPYPNKPLIPKLKEVTINYQASSTIRFNQELLKSTISEENRGELKHITPFGLEDVINNQEVKKYTLVEDFKQDGYLFLGIKGSMEGATVSIYFHLLQSSTSKKIHPKGLVWEYFQRDKWIAFEDERIILDETNGFVKSGIVELVLPNLNDFDQDEKELYWIRVSTLENVQHYPKIKGIYLNAVEAVCMSDDPVIIGKEIPAGSIKKNVGKSPNIKKVNQPSPSYGGVLEESSHQFYTKVSERLRHKSRAVSIWDYERLILEEFKEVRAVKCTNLDASFNAQPGKVKVIVLSSNWVHNERHYFDQGKLDDMKQFLQKKSSPFIDIEIVNPKVEYLLVNCMVEFMPEDNGGYYTNLLNQDIADFLSPISNIKNNGGGIGKSVIPNMVISFIDHLPYIKKVDKLTVEHITRDRGNHYSLGVYSSGQEIKTKLPWSILCPVKQHNIVNIMNDKKVVNMMDVGLGNMEIGLDLIVNTITEGKHQIATSNDSNQQVNESKTINDSILVFKNKS